MKSTPPVRFRRSMSGKISIAGREIHSAGIQSFWLQVTELLKNGEPYLVITLNVDQTIRLTTDLEFRLAFNQAAIVTLDGMPLVNFLKIFLHTKSVRLTGADILLQAAKFASVNNLKLCLLGGAPDIAKKACSNLREMHPSLIVEAIDFPFVEVSDFQTNSLTGVVDHLNEFKPNLVFVCLGSPKQEIFFQSHTEILPAGIYIGSGASLDFIGEWKIRAPELVQHLSLEWAWRLVQEPRRLARRYLITGWRILPILFFSLKK